MQTFIVTVPDLFREDSLYRGLVRATLDEGGGKTAVSQVTVRSYEIRDEGFIRLVVLITKLRRSLPYVGMAYLLKTGMSRRTTGTTSPAEREALIGAALEEGIIEKENIEHGGNLVEAVRLNTEHELVRDTLSRLRDASMVDDFGEAEIQ